MSDLDAKLAESPDSTTICRPSSARPETSTDPARSAGSGQELSRLEPIVEAFRRLEATRAELAGARELRDSSDADDELRGMARDEIDRLEADETRLVEELKVLLLPRDPNDEPRRDHGDPGRRRRRGGGPVRGRAATGCTLRYAERHRFTPSS